MSNKRRRKRKIRNSLRPSCHLTTGDGAKPYDAETLALIAGLVPDVEVVHPLGIEHETDQDRLLRARGMAGHHHRPFGAVVRIDTLGTKYFHDQVLGAAASVTVMRTKVRHVGADAPCPFSTMVVVFDPRVRTALENGCRFYWEPRA